LLAELDKIFLVLSKEFPIAWRFVPGRCYFSPSCDQF
jgi:hypothetical protein